jgi:hypothetical protein
MRLSDETVRGMVAGILKDAREGDIEQGISQLMTVPDIQRKLMEKHSIPNASSAAIRKALKAMLAIGAVEAGSTRGEYRWLNAADHARRDKVKRARAIGDALNAASGDGSEWWTDHERSDILGIDIGTLEKLISPNEDGQLLRAIFHEIIGKVDAPAKLTECPPAPAT